MDDRAKRVQSLSADDLRKLMARLKKGQGEAERIGRAPRDGSPLPLSFAQESLWFLDRLGGGAAVYNVPAAVRLTGPLDATALRRTFEEIARRHEALRTTFDARDGAPFQVIAPEPAVDLPVADLSALPAAAREREMLRLATAEAGRPFDLRRGPLLRTTLLRLGGGEHVLVLTLHHIVSDGWSAGVLIREMAALYDAFCAGRPSPLPELPIQYADYAVWQRRHLSGETLEKELAFWRERLAGTPPLELPTDRPRPAAASFQGGHRPVEISDGTLPSANVLARELDGTLYMVLLAAFETLLLRYSGQTDFAVGAPVANRGRGETEGLIGFFVNTLALRSSLADGLTFRGLLGRVKEGTLAAFAHEEMPFDKLVEELQPEREAGRNPLFQVVLNLQNQPRPALAMGGLGLATVEIEGATAKFDLTLSWSEEEGRLRGDVEYSAALFDGATAERLGRHFATLLAGAATGPDRSLWELPLLDEAERRQTLIDWNRTALPYPGETPVHELFAAWAERTPQAVAVEFGDARLTYAELNGRANRLAHRLRRLGVGPEELVVLAVPRSLEMIEGMMGILKAGGAYLPLDPTQPRERLAFLVEGSRPAAVVTLEAHLGALPDFGARAVCLDRDRGSLAGEPADDPRSGVTADNLVYVLYTSGSTGRPKAVAVPHRGLVRLVAGDYARLDAGETFFQFAPLSFDPSTLEIFGALANGGRLAVAPVGPFSLAELGRVIRRHGVTTLWLTSGLFHQMIEEGLDDLRGVRQLLSGGDVLSPPHVRRALEALPGVELIDGYGPTENSCFTTCYRVDRDAPPDAYVPIGKPMANTTVYILDREMRPLPVGVPGELLTGGDGLARGYRGRPELTAERFVPSPFAGDLDPAGARLYRTGDLARWRPDGNVEFLGRMDSQVKIRGYRIEPGEVEAVLGRHPALAECAVVVRREGSGEKRLVACYVPAAPVTPVELKEHLGASLPAYMIPAAFLEMSELPLTVSGKVDRRALSRLEAPAGDGPNEIYAEPRTEVEQQIAAIWRDLLGRERIGLNDSFFDLGGHSLLATRVLSRLRKTLRADLPLSVVFERPTLAGLAIAVEEAVGTVVSHVTPRPPGDDDLPLSFSQERLWFLDRLDPGAPFYNIAATLRLSGRLDVLALAASFDEVLRRHEALRTVFLTVEGQPRQRVLPFTPRTVPLIDLSSLPGPLRDEEAARVDQQYADWRFDLTRGPMLVAALLRLEPDVHHCAAVFHHVASDGWSLGVFCQEIAALYPAFLEGRPSPLPELPVQYPDFALWQRRAIAGTLEGEVAYWLERLSGEIAPLELPTDRPRPAVQSYRGRSLMADLPPTLGERLNALSQREGATLFMTLLAAAEVLLHRWSGQDDILVGAPIAGRQRVETEGLIGFFLNTLVLRTDLSGNPSFRDLLARVRDVTLGAYNHQDVPFEALLARLPQQRDPSRTPLFQVMFNMLNLPGMDAVSLPGLTLEPFAVPDLPSKFDLTFYVTERPDHGIFVHLLYNADLFDGGRMEDLLAQLTRVLEQAAENPETPIEALSLVTPGARTVLPDPAAPLDGSWVGAIHDLFSARARSAPERPAISDREGTWSYGELETAANRLAHGLIAAGIRKGDRVAVWAHRSAPVAAAVMGALKAGAAFTMLDPAYPPVRLVEILKIAAPRALVRLEAGGPLPDGVDIWLSEAGCSRIDLPRGGAVPVLDRLAGFPGEPPAVTTGPDDVAVLGFTSGSTGTPKGIAGRHGPLTHFLPWQCERFGMTAEDRFSLLSGLAHDPLQRDLFTPLYLGATIVVPEPEDIGVSGRLAAWAAREGVTVAHLTPAMGQILTERPTGGAFVEASGLRLVLLVGDALTRLDVARLRRLAPRVTCVNLYGSTETQRAVAYHICEETGEDAKQVLPLGAGMRDVQLLVINRAGQLAGVGEVGEIAVRSPHLAQGYLGDEALTADKFRINPFTGRAGDRIYRTGDLGRYLPDGEVVFAGRADQQVKIRGFRIEPAEIEARLAALPGVREAVVVAREDRGEKRLVAYVVAEGAVSPAFLRQALRDRLPAYMVPAAFVLLERLPITPNGKVDRRALPAPVEEVGEAPGQAQAPESEVEERIAAVWREVLGVERIGVTDNFFDVGGHSLLLVRLHSRLQEVLGREISLMELFNHPNIRSQADHLAGRAATQRRARRPEPEAADERPAGGIAVVGLAGRFPRARDLEAFWRNLRDGVEAVSFFTDEELAGAGADPDLLASPRYVKARGVLEDEAMFDAEFFDVPPRQAELMDPQLRHFLECSWEALENAGYDPARFPGQIGVYGGVTLSTYFLNNLAANRRLLEEAGTSQTAIATDRDFLTTQVSYKLNLRGPSLTVQTACSTSLVAVHLAAMALLAGECDMALAGGVSIKVPQVTGYLHHPGGLDSSDGHCRAFDARADGTVYGAGVGVVVLKRLEDALADGDSIHAVILGSAINNDGAGKVGYTAPSLEGQSRAVAEAHAAAGVDPETIGYVECHGSATALGDAIEVAALTRAFATPERGGCAIGSVKTNIGHLGAAAGVAALVKTVLALERGEIPPSLHFETPNPQIDFAASPFYVNTRLADWPAESGPRRAGVSSFGIGGTNAHLVLEEAPAPEPTGPARPWQLLLLSARTEAALDAATHNLAGWLERNPRADLADVAYTLQVGRRTFSHRRALVCRDAGEALRQLRVGAPEALHAVQGGGRPSVVFLFPGEEAADPGMARGLHESEPVFRQEIDRCARLLRERLGRDLREVLFAAGEERWQGRPSLLHPAIFAVEHALAQLWISWGVRPEALLGSGLGETVAACLAGVLSLEDALRLVVERALWREEAPEEQPAERLAALLETVRLAPPRIPYLSSVTGTWIRPEEATDPGYWARQATAPARCAEALEELWKQSSRVLLEVGPGQALTTLARQHPAGLERGVIPTLPDRRGERPAVAAVTEALGALWLAGIEIDWDGFHAGARRRRLPLPTYPFERRRFWIDPRPWAGLAAAEPAGPEGWLLAPTWGRSPLPAGLPPRAAGEPLWLLLAPPNGPGARLAERIEERLAAAGRETLRLGVPAAGDAGSWARDLAATGRWPGRIVHLGGIAGPDADGVEDGLVPPVRALAGERAGRRCEICVVSTHLHDLGGGEIVPRRGALLASCRRISREIPGLVCRSVDLPPDLEEADRWAERLINEVARGGERVVAYGPRGQRWVNSLGRARVGGPGLDLAPGGFCLLLTRAGGGDLEEVAERWLAAEGVEARRLEIGTRLPEIPAEGPAPLGLVVTAGGGAETLDDAERRLLAARELARHGAGFALVLAAGGDEEAAASCAERFALREAQESEIPWRVVTFEGSLPPALQAAEALRHALDLGHPQIIIAPPAPLATPPEEPEDVEGPLGLSAPEPEEAEPENVA